MDIPFWKMQGAGNDFILLNNMELGLSDQALKNVTKHVCQKRLSLGSDAVIAVDSPQKTGDIRMRFFNADGTEAEMCGNGVRCLARYAYEKKFVSDSMQIETMAGLVAAWRLEKRLYKVALNSPYQVKQTIRYGYDGIETVDYCELGNPGVPHLVVSYPKLATTPLEDLVEIARRLRFWEQLPKGANVNFYQLMPSGEVLIRTYERGVEGFTYACGTGAGATAYFLHRKREISQNPITLSTRGGILQIEMTDNHLFFFFYTTIVAKGVICDENLRI